MSSDDPIDLLFGGMAKLGPGDDAQTLHVLHRLPKQRFDLVVDAGCGCGRQTLALAKALATPIHAVDTHAPFLDDLARRAADAGIAHLVQTHCFDMEGIPRYFPRIDLLWSEGAAYNVGFANALATWRQAIAPGGFVVVSELAWLREHAPETVSAFFKTGYPDMQHITENVALAERAGYTVLDTYTLPDAAWTDGYYDVLEPRATALLDHADPAVRELARETLQEIAVFRASDGSYGYVFYVLQTA